MRQSPAGCKLSFLLFFCRSFQLLSHSELHNPANQIEGNWLVQWKSYRSLSSFVGGELALEPLNPSWQRIQADMRFEGGKVNQIAIQREGRHLVLDGFLCARRCLSDGQPDLFQDFLHVAGEASDIFVDVLGRYWLGSHLRYLRPLNRHFFRSAVRQYVPGARAQVVEPNQVDVVAAAVLRDLEQL